MINTTATEQTEGQTELEEMSINAVIDRLSVIKQTPQPKALFDYSKLQSDFIKYVATGCADPYLTLKAQLISNVTFSQ